MLRFRTSCAAAVFAASLGLAACQPGGDQASAPTEVSAAEAQDALIALNLAEPGELRWDERSFDDGVYTFTGLSFSREDMDAPLRAERLVLAAPRLEDDMVRFDRLEITGLSLSDPDDADLTLQRVIIDRPGPALSQVIADALNGREPEVDLAQEDFARWTFADIGLEGLQIAITDAAGGASDLALTRLGARGFDGDRMAEIALEGFALEASSAETGDVTASLEALSMEGLAAPFLRLMLASGSADNPVAAAINPVNAAEFYDGFAMRGLDVNAGGVMVVMPEMSATVETRGGEVRQRSAMDQLTVSADPSGPLGAQFQGALALLGYEELNITMAGDSVYDIDEDRSRTSGENYIEITDGLRIDLEQDVSGLQVYLDRYLQAAASGALANGDVPMEVFEPLVIHSMAMRIEDRSLLERALNAAGAMQGVPPEQLRLQAAGLIGLGLAAAPAEIPRPLVASLGQALAQFIHNGGTIEMVMAPAEPVSVGAMMDSGFDAEALGLTVTAEPPAQ